MGSHRRPRRPWVARPVMDKRWGRWDSRAGARLADARGVRLVDRQRPRIRETRRHGPSVLAVRRVDTLRLRGRRPPRAGSGGPVVSGGNGRAGMIGSRRSSVPLPGLDTRIAVGPAPSQIEAWHKTGRFSEPGLRFVWKMIVTPPTRSSEPRPISRLTRAANSRVWTTVLRCFKLSRRRRIASFRVASSVRASATMRRDREGGDALGSPAGVATDARREWPAGAAAAAGPIRCFLAVLSHRSLACVRTLAIESNPHRRLGEFPRARCNSRLPFRPRGSSPSLASSTGRSA